MGRADRWRRWPRLPRLSSALQSHGVSVLVHGAGLAALLALTPLAARLGEPIEVELVAAVVPRQRRAPEPPPPPAVESSADPEPPRPDRVPREARVERVRNPRAHHARARDLRELAERTPPDETPASVDLTPAPRFEVSMEATVEGDEGVEVLASGAGKNARADPGQRGVRGVRGPAPPRRRPARVDLAESWEISTLPEPLNSRRIKPAYPATARSQGVEAVVVLELDIDAEGRVVDAELVRRAGNGFDRSALAYCRKLRFSPARAGDKPVAARIRWEVHYRFDNE